MAAIYLDDNDNVWVQGGVPLPEEGVPEPPVGEAKVRVSNELILMTARMIRERWPGRYDQIPS